MVTLLVITIITDQRQDQLLGHDSGNTSHVGESLCHLNSQQLQEVLAVGVEMDLATSREEWAWTMSGEENVYFLIMHGSHVVNGTIF